MSILFPFLVCSRYAIKGSVYIPSPVIHNSNSVTSFPNMLWIILKCKFKGVSPTCFLKQVALILYSKLMLTHLSWLFFLLSFKIPQWQGATWWLWMLGKLVSKEVAFVTVRIDRKLHDLWGLVQHENVGPRSKSRKMVLLKGLLCKTFPFKTILSCKT